MSLPFYIIRHLWLRLFGMKMGRHNAIKRNVEIRFPQRIIIGDYTTINRGVLLDGRGFLEIGSNVEILIQFLQMKINKNRELRVNS